MASRSKSDKYWLANNPNGQVTDAQIVALKSLSDTDLDNLDGMVAELETMTDAIPVAAEASLVDALDGVTMSSSADTLTTSATPTLDELEAAVGVLGNKVNEILAKLRTAGIIAS